MRIVVISVIAAVIYFEIRGYEKGKAGERPKTGETNGMKNRRQVSNSEKCEVYTSENAKDQWESLYKNGFITREEYAEHFGKR